MAGVHVLQPPRGGVVVAVEERRVAVRPRGLVDQRGSGGTPAGPGPAVRPGLRPERRPQAGHEERGGDPLPGDVADRDAQPRRRASTKS